MEFSAKVLGEITRGYAFDYDEFVECLGPRWCFHLRPWIQGIPMTYIKNREWATHAEMKRFGELGMTKMAQGARDEEWLIGAYLKFFE